MTNSVVRNAKAISLIAGFLFAQQENAPQDLGLLIFEPVISTVGRNLTPPAA